MPWPFLWRFDGLDRCRNDKFLFGMASSPKFSKFSNKDLTFQIKNERFK